MLCLQFMRLFTPTLLFSSCLYCCIYSFFLTVFCCKLAVLQGLLIIQVVPQEYNDNKGRVKLLRKGWQNFFTTSFLLLWFFSSFQNRFRSHYNKGWFLTEKADPSQSGHCLSFHCLVVNMLNVWEYHWQTDERIIEINRKGRPVCEEDAKKRKRVR